jgi:hypothetical protein
MQPRCGPNRKHHSSVNVGCIVSRVPLRWHCSSGAWLRGNTASHSSLIVAWRHCRRTCDVFAVTQKSFLLCSNLVTALYTLQNCSMTFSQNCSWRVLSSYNAVYTVESTRISQKKMSLYLRGQKIPQVRNLHEAGGKMTLISSLAYSSTLNMKAHVPPKRLFTFNELHLVIFLIN